MFWSKLIIHQKALYDFFFMKKVVKWCKKIRKVSSINCQAHSPQMDGTFFDKNIFRIENQVVV